MAKGARTRAVVVAANAIRWVGSLDRQMKLYPALQAHYHPKRFAYFLERTQALVTTLGSQLQLGEGKRLARKTANDRLAAAFAARHRIVVALRRFAAHRADHLTEIAEARGSDQTTEGLILSIARLAALGARWMAAGPSTLVEVAGLTEGLLDDVRSTGESLASAGADVLESGQVDARDTPEINLVEGWVLEEMIRVREDVAEAKKEDPRIELLVGQRGTWHVVGRKRRRPTADDPTAAAPSEPANEEAAASPTAKTGAPTSTPLKSPVAAE